MKISETINNNSKQKSLVLKMKSDDKKTTPISKMAESSRHDSIASSVSSKPDNPINLNSVNGSGASPSSPPSTKDMNSANNDINKAKSCKGYLYYSTRLKADSRNPVCAGVTRSLPKLSQLYVGQSEMEASKEGRTLVDFRYACIGYSLYTDQKGEKFNAQETQTELPMCVGFEMLVDRRVNTADSISAPGTHIHNREDGSGLPNHQSPRPTKPTGEEFFSRFARNANLITNGVAKNARRVGNQIKQCLDDVLYLSRRPPK